MTNQNRIAVAIFAGGILAFATILYFGLRSPPQMGASDESFKTVDALYTAIRSENQQRVSACEVRLQEQRDSGKLPERAWKSLAAIIERAKAGKWQPAAESLYDFMRGQRRES